MSSAYQSAFHDADKRTLAIGLQSAGLVEETFAATDGLMDAAERLVVEDHSPEDAPRGPGLPPIGGPHPLQIGVGKAIQCDAQPGVALFQPGDSIGGRMKELLVGQALQPAA